ncbi:hypothetical protein KKF59_04275 [Patescibacteria group bacterium]|nr:hypothetical protein [Patescibacteria group bacterium]MBU1034650.1 hypothetical protein [Patescibacteria group bacterium]MBU1629662.1 hypothetical protein [Patescibacteria group bacterium]MBU1908310.1 hypothetical protein [Patescibacteria group bacterium]
MKYINLERAGTVSLLLATIGSCAFLLGGGCMKTGGGLKPAEPSGSELSTFDGVDSQEAAKRINFVVGSIIEMKEKVRDFETDSQEIKDGVRTLTIERFAPGVVADVSWRLVTQVETEDSKNARAAAEKAKTEVPEPSLVDHILTGIVRNFNLSNSHLLYLPSYWPVKDEAPAFEAGGLWLSDDAFAGLSRNRVATFDFGILHPSLTTATTLPAEIQKTLEALNSEMKKIENRIDVYRLDGEQDLVEWPLSVNGEDTMVSAIKAHTWFGDLVVLNNAQNPLVLKFDLNPGATGETELFAGQNLLKDFVGYEITSIRDVRFQ